jgi:tetratricopeptide (TPR) repeat protein
MLAFVVLALAAVRADTAEQAWINQVREADHLIEEGRYNEAEEAYISARKQAELLGADQLPMAITLNRIGYQCHITGRLREAERAYAAALTIVEKRFGAASHNAVNFAMDLSTAYFELDKISQAEWLIRRFLSLDAQLSANDRAIVLAELASVLAARQKFAEAESLYQQALPFFEREPDGESRERTVIILSDLSNCYVHMQRREEGTRYSDRALAALSRIANPPAHLSFKTIANAAAVSAAVDRSPEETDSLFQSAISLCERTFGRDHYLLDHVLANYSEFLRKTGRRAEAKRTHQRSNAILDRFSKENLLGHTIDAKAFR